MTAESLNVIALISGGKDSFFNLLHCIRHGHRIVALSNLYPAADGTTAAPQDVQFIDPTQSPTAQDAQSIEEDLNSFMYQTVGHEVIPLYAAATGLPLYRQPIRGGALHHERDYDYSSGEQEDVPSAVDETESMLLLLRAIKARHPEANALCSGAILSTYQRTRVESIALRLGLTPLAYLWKYPVLPPPADEAADEALLLRDMAVASAGLDESHLWERVSSTKGFDAAEGASLGEGGEFETLVLDGPSWLFKKKISIPEQGRKVVNEGGGSTWLMLRGAHLEDKVKDSDAGASPESSSILDTILSTKEVENSGRQSTEAPKPRILGNNFSSTLEGDDDTLRWSVLASPASDRTSIEAEMQSVVSQIRDLLSSSALDAAQITNTTIILRNMLFAKPNPPSRVTISCGPLLPSGYNVMAFLTVPRSGSRSYWAPANIGPYSQAIDVSVSAKAEETGVRATYIAGQIPLIPASMALPPPSETGYAMQVTLSLQHLWRIGLEMKVQLWSSAVAYFAKSSSPDEMKRYAKAAGLAWKLAHGSPEDDEEDENELDPWDLKHNSQYASLGHSQENARASLPDWSIFTLRQQNEPESCIPPFFAAEVEELPRQSLVEWHAHVGLSQIEEGSAEIVYQSETTSSCWRAWHMFVRTARATLVYTTLAHMPSPDDGNTSWGDLQQELSAAYASSAKALGLAPLVHHATPHLAYVEATSVAFQSSDVGDAGPSVPFATIPCHTLWSAGGERIKCVALYKMVLGHMQREPRRADGGGFAPHTNAPYSPTPVRRSISQDASLPGHEQDYRQVRPGPLRADVTMASHSPNDDVDAAASTVALPKKTLSRADLQPRRQSTDRINDILETALQRAETMDPASLSLLQNSASRRASADNGASAATGRGILQGYQTLPTASDESDTSRPPRKVSYSDATKKHENHGHSLRRRNGAAGPEDADGTAKAKASKPSWTKETFRKFQSLELENKGSVARDHLALAFASIGVAVTQLFRLNTGNASANMVDFDHTKLQRMGRPLGATFLGISIVTLLLGCKRYFHAQEWILKGKFPASRGTILIMSFVALSLMILSLVVVIVIQP
ncbi:hypothetical protein ACQKWADRAFT_317922 [Trichoderma austrokoningii]